MERECAKVLDYYGVRYEYEPHTFVLERDAEGRVVEAFTPDFFLPEQGLYIELTTMKQSLVTRKNRKLRRLREQYPDVKREALLQARHRAPGTAIRARHHDVAPRMPSSLLSGRAPPRGECRRRGADPRIGEVYLTPRRSHARVAELGAEIAADYDGREPLLVAPLKASIVFLADLSRAMPILHHMDFVELAAYNGGADGGSIKLLKDLDGPIDGRDVLIVEDVVDTGLTLNYLRKTLNAAQPGLAPRGDAARPPVPPHRRGPARALRRLHRPGRVLRRLRLRRRRAVPQPARSARQLSRWKPATSE